MARARSAVPRNTPPPTDPPQEQSTAPAAQEQNTVSPETQETILKPKRKLSVIAAELEELSAAVQTLESDLEGKRSLRFELVAEMQEAESALGLGKQLTLAPSSSTPAPSRAPVRRQKSAATASDREEKETIRLYLKEINWRNPATGHLIGDMGPIPKAGYDAYDAAH